MLKSRLVHNYKSLVSNERLFELGFHVSRQFGMYMSSSATSTTRTTHRVIFGMATSKLLPSPPPTSSPQLTLLQALGLQLSLLPQGLGTICALCLECFSPLHLSKTHSSPSLGTELKCHLLQKAPLPTSSVASSPLPTQTPSELCFLFFMSLSTHRNSLSVCLSV